MQDEAYDKVLSGAFDQYNPPVNDAAWQRMEQLLDVHLPVDKKRRRRWFWLWLLPIGLLGGGTLYWLQTHPSPAGVTTASTNSQPVTSATANNNTEINKNDNKANNTDAAKNTTYNTISTAVVPQDAGQNAAPPVTVTYNGQSSNSSVTGSGDITRSTRPGITRQQGSTNSNGNALLATGKNITGKTKAKQKISVLAATPDVDADVANDDKVNATTTAQDKEVNQLPIAVSANSKNDVVPTVPVTASVKKDSGVAIPQPVEKSAENPAPVTAKRLGKKQSRGFGNNFAFTVSAGADMSFVTLDRPGQVRLAKGIGVAYQLGSRVSIHSGFYAARKIYSTDTTGYKWGRGLFPNTTDIRGNCKVYEVPIGINYHFLPKRNHQWLAGVAISSLYMKTESYRFKYIYAGQMVEKSYSVADKNNHLFSALTLSGAYRYKVSNWFTVQASPYLQVPLNGIGLGKVKLQSSGVLFTAILKPFARKP